MISQHSSLIIQEGNKSWTNVDFSKTEPEIIREYLLTPGKGVDYLNQKISTIISSQTRFEIKFASVYCHQKPRVKRTTNSLLKCKGSTPSCELGDLMTIFVLLDRNKKIVYSTAKIMQAKRKNILDSESQKCLYESDLEFEMPQNIVNQSTNSNIIRTLPNYNNKRSDGLSYLILNDGSPKNKEIPSASNLIYDWSFHLELMMEFKTGLPFVPPNNPQENDWNCIINDLLNVGTGKVKSQTVRSGFGLDYFVNAFNDYDYFPEFYLDNNDFGIPKLIILCKDTELKSQ